MKNNSRSFFRLHRCLIIALAFISGNTVAQNKSRSPSGQTFRDVTAIASDNTEGRFTASAGYNLAAGYVIAELKKAGVKPGWTNSGGSKTFLQPVPFIRKSYGKHSVFLVRQAAVFRRYPHPSAGFIVVHPGRAEKKPEIAPASTPVYIGFGIEEPAEGWNDFTNLPDLSGKWVIALQGIPDADSSYAPGSSFSPTLRHRYEDGRRSDSLKIAALHRHRVAGVILLPDAAAAKDWETAVIRRYRFSYMHYSDSGMPANPVDTELPTILISPDAACALFSGSQYNPLHPGVAYRRFSLSGTTVQVSIREKIEKVNGFNIIGFVPGTDDSLNHQIIVAGAHLDHVGKIGEHIYNGANDDASGCVALLGAARGLAREPARRPILFVFFAGEELNLIGSGHFVRHPPLPLKDILLNINLEQVGSRHRDFPGIWAIGDTGMSESFFRSGASFPPQQLKFDNVTGMEEVLRNCDSWPFYQHQIPSIVLGSGGFPEHHTTLDKIDLIDFPQLGRATQLLLNFVERLAGEGIQR